MSSLRKRSGSPYWVACFTLPDGTRTQQSTGQKDRHKAMAVCLEWTEASKQAHMGNFTEAQARKVVSVISEKAGLGPVEFATAKQFLNEWAQSKETTKAGGTAKRYRHTVDEFLKLLGSRAEKNLAAIHPRDIQAYRDLQKKEGKSNATANMIVKVLRVAFNQARKQGLLLTNPAEAVDLLPSAAGTRDTFTRDQIRDLLAVADIEWRGMILFGACHGIRISDIAALTWANINADRQSLRFSPKKTKNHNKGKVEEYPLHPDIIDYLESLPSSDNPKAPLFPVLSKKPVSGAGGLSLQFRKLMRKAAIQTEEEFNDGSNKRKGKGRRFFNLSFHSLRHTAISEQANQGVSQEVRMKLSGHKSKVHERYTHHELETLRKEIEKVPSFTNKNPDK